MRLPRICRRCASGSARNCDCGERLSPSWRGAWSRRAGHAVGRAGGPCRGRCKYVHVSSVAASMRLTPLHDPPALPSTVSGGRPPRKKERRATAGSRARLLAAEHGSALQEAEAEKEKGRGEGCVLFLFHQFVSNPMLLLAGPQAPWRLRAPMDGFTACPAIRPRPAQPSATQSRFVVQPTNSRLYQALASARRRRTSARQRGASTSSPIGQLTPVPPIPQYPFGFFARYCWW